MSLQSYIAQARADVDRLAPAAAASATTQACAKGWDGHIIGSPFPAGERLYAMATQFARPVARGELHLSAAHSALINATLKAERENQLGTYKAAHIVKGLRHILRLNLDRDETRRAIAAARIKRTIRPLIAAHKPPNVLLAEAHGVNGADDFPFVRARLLPVHNCVVDRITRGNERGNAAECRLPVC